MAIEADALLGGPYLDSRLGRFDVARDKLERSKAICREFGIAYGLAEAHIAGAEMEELAGDLMAAERETREAIRLGTEMGASRYVAMYRTDLASLLLDQGVGTSRPPPSSNRLASTAATRRVGRATARELSPARGESTRRSTRRGPPQPR